MNPYGWQHQQRREQALAMFVDGTPCPLCGHAMRQWQALDLDHALPIAYGGGHDDSLVRLTHASCNRRRGQRISSVRRRIRSAIEKGRTAAPVTARRARRTITESNRREW